METLLDLLDEAVARYAERPALRAHRDDGHVETWTYRDLGLRARAAAWRLRALGLDAGDRLLTWSPSMPELPAVYFGAMRVGLVLVPLDVRMAPDAVEQIVERARARHLALGTGRDAPDPREAGLGHFPTTTVEALAAPPDTSFPADWEAQLETWARPRSDDLFDLIFTSGTTGRPEGRHARPFDRPRKHRGDAPGHPAPRAPGRERAAPEPPVRAGGRLLLRPRGVGADILYVRSRNPRVLFDAIREHRMTSMVAVPQILDLFWTAIEREVEKAAGPANPTGCGASRVDSPTPPGASCSGACTPAWADRSGSSCLPASLPPALQQAWEDLGIVVIQGYGSTESGFGTCTSREDHGLGTVGRTQPPIEMRLAPDGEILFRGPSIFRGYFKAEASAAAFTDDGWYRSGDIGRFDTGAPRPDGADQGHHRAAQRAQRLPRGR